MSESSQALERFDWAGGYLRAGRVLGTIAAIVTFLGGWLYSVGAYGFLLGGSLGWIPSAIAAFLAFWFVAYLWGLLLGVGLFWAISLAATREASEEPDTVVGVATDTAATTPLPTFEQPQPPPVPITKSAERAIADFQGAHAAGGMGSAVALTMECYNRLSANWSWGEWDYCAALDELGAATSRDSARPTEYFALWTVQSRQQRTSKLDPTSAMDRIAALKAILRQASDEQTRKQAIAVQREGSQPSIDCSHAVGDVLRLICQTPALGDADREMAAAYHGALARVDEPGVLRKDQRAWIEQRNGSAADTALLATMYAERTELLRSVGTSDETADPP